MKKKNSINFIIIWLFLTLVLNATLSFQDQRVSSLNFTDTHNSVNLSSHAIPLIEFTTVTITPKWNKTYLSSTQPGSGLAIDSSNNIFFGGPIAGTGGAWSNITLIKYDSLGNQLYNGNSSGYHWNILKDLAIDSKGNISATGWLDTPSFDENICLLRYNSTCSQLWDLNFENSLRGYGEAIAVDKQDNIYIVGSNGTYGSNGIVLLKFDNFGNSLWNRTWLNSGAQEGNDIAIDSKGNIYVTGYNISSGYETLILLKYDSQGTSIWNRSWNANMGMGLGNARGIGVAIDMEDIIYVTGYVKD